MGRYDRGLLKRFMDFVRSDWQWTGYKACGYGRMKVDGKMVGAHRVSFELFNAPIPEGMEVMHSCDDPGCVDPEHLHIGTHKDNMHECVERRRSAVQAGEENGSAKLTQAKADEIRKLYVPRKYTMPMLCKRFGVSSSAIQRIIYGKSWIGLPDETMGVIRELLAAQ